jgi:cbb3-type cytochrome oxidase subunit 3
VGSVGLSLWFTSVTLYIAEGVLTWMFFVGLWWLCGWSVRRMRGAPFAVENVDEGFLRRWCFFQILFIAVWSILFKGVLYTTLRHSTAHYLLAKSQSFGISIPAECVAFLLMLVGVVTFGLRVSRRRSSDGAS